MVHGGKLPPVTPGSRITAPVLAVLPHIQIPASAPAKVREDGLRP